MRCRRDISPGAFGKTLMECHSVFFVRRSLVTIVSGQQNNQDPPKVFLFFAMLTKIEAKGEASKAQRLILSKPRVSKALEAHCARMPKSIELRAFGGTGEPRICPLGGCVGQRARSTRLLKRDPVKGKR